MDNHPQSIKDLKAIFKQYLDLDTNSALLITGEWGVGKTHFYDNVLVKEVIEAKEIPKKEEVKKRRLRRKKAPNEKQTYKSIRISLFGIDNLDALKMAMLTSVYTFMQGERYKLAEALIGTALKLLPTGDEIIDKIKNHKKENLDLRHIVICFDDLERTSESFDIKTFIGYVNTLVEEGQKVVIITNESEIKDVDTYSKIKEKVIGTTMVYNVPLKDVFEELIKAKFKNDSTYLTYLESESNFIFKLFEKGGCKNLRTLIFSLSLFKLIFKEIEEKYPKLLENESNWKSKLKSILECILTLSIEYKNHKFTHKDEHELKDMTIESWTQLKYLNELFKDDKQTEDKELDFKGQFHKKYIKGNASFHIYHTIFDFLTGNQPFDLEKLEKELSVVFNERALLPQYQLSNQLVENRYGIWGNDEFRENFEKMIDYVKNGDYKYGDIVTIFAYIQHHNDVLGYNLDNLLVEFQQAIDLISTKTEPISQTVLNIHLNFQGIEEWKKERLIKLKEKILEVNQKNVVQDENISADADIKMLKENPIEFFKLYTEKKPKEILPILRQLGQDDFIKLVLRFSNEEICYLINFLNFYIDIPENMNTILTYLEPLEIELKAKITTPKTWQMHLFEELIKEIEKIRIELKKHQPTQ